MSMFSRTGTLVRRKSPRRARSSSYGSASGSLKSARTCGSLYGSGSFRRSRADSCTAGSFRRTRCGSLGDSFKRPRRRDSGSVNGSCRSIRTDGSIYRSSFKYPKDKPIGGSLKYTSSRTYNGSFRYPKNGNSGDSLKQNGTNGTDLDSLRQCRIDVSPPDLVKSTQKTHDSQLRSVTETIVSFDDERQLVRTSVGWSSCNHSDAVQEDYGALCYLLHEAGKESENVIEFACKTSTIICSTLFVTFMVGLSMTLPVAMVSIGVKYLDDCPKEPRIPVYLLVGGCFGMMKLISSLWRNIQARRYQDIEVVFDDHDSDGAFASTTYRTMDFLLMLFLLGWQVAGTYWALEIWTPNFKQLLHEPSNWCDRTVYMFSIYQIFGCYGLLAVYILVLFSIMCCYKCSNCCRV